jgi:hypothetical protein
LRIINIALAVSTAFGLGSCGTYVPEIQDFGDSTAGQIYVHDIVKNVYCEVRNAVYDLYHQEAGSKDISFLDKWGAQLDLTLTVNENGSVAPATQFFPLGQPKNWKFNWGFNATVGSSATRTETISFFYLISDLKQFPCGPREDGPMLLQSDLKFKEWLYDAVDVDVTDVVSLPGTAKPSASSGPSTKSSNVLTHTVTFVLTTTGGVSPQWALVNTSFVHIPVSFGRVRTHTMLVTLGPTAPTPDDKKGTTKQLAPTALNIAQAQNTAIFITTIINNNNVNGSGN